jgi:hypothetical protein
MRTCGWGPGKVVLDLLLRDVEAGKADRKEAMALLEFWADNENACAREVFGQLLVVGRIVEKNVSRGLCYLKMAFDTPGYAMKDMTFFRNKCPGFYDFK